MNWTNVRLIFLREVRDQLRDRRTLFTIAVLPLLLYPLLGMSFLQVAQFSREHPSQVWIVGAAHLPSSPPLLEGAHFAKPFVAADKLPLLKLNIEAEPPPQADPEWMQRAAEYRLRQGKCDAVIYFPPDFGSRLDRFREALQQRHTGQAQAEPLSIPQPELFVDTASDKSRIALARLETVLRNWRQAIVEENLRQSHIPVTATEPFRVAERDVSQAVQRRAAVWSKILPFVVLVWALTGAFYPAIDLCAGEKERGTLETLLSSPAQRGEIVAGKLMTVMVFSMATSMLNLTSMGLTGSFVVAQMQRLGVSSTQWDMGGPPLLAVGWLVLALIPISALFSALSLAVAAFARSSKEGQYYLMPLLLITLPLMLLPLLPAAELDLGTSLIPVSGVMLLLRSLIEGQLLEALRFSLPAFGVTALCCFFAIRWAIDQFNDERVLFRESERWGLGLWLRHLVRDRSETPSLGEAVLCGVLLLVIRFFVSFLADAPNSWLGFAQLTTVNLIAFIATPAVIMAIMLTRNVPRTLLLKRPPSATLPAAFLLALLFHPVGLTVAAGVQQLYPLSPEMEAQLYSMQGLVQQAPSFLWILGVLALAPAICEELAFRGFILSGLRHVGHRWAAIIISSLFFGATHAILQQSLTAFVLGLVLGYLAIRSGSLLPGVIFHFTYNALSLWTSLQMPAWRQRVPLLEWIFPSGEGNTLYHAPIIAVGLIGSGVLLFWFRSLPCEATEEEVLQAARDHQVPHREEMTSASV